MNLIRLAFACVPALAVLAGPAAAQEKPEAPASQTMYTPRQLTALVQIGQIAFAVFMYESWNGAPSQTLESLVTKPDGAKNWPEGGYLPGGKIPRDPWGGEFLYKPKKKRSGSPPDIKSLGADGKEGGEGENADLTVEDIGRLAEAVQIEQGRERATRPAAMAMMGLKTLCTAQADFRSNDRDGNLVNDFWTGDVHGLAWLMSQTPGKQEWPAADEKLAIRLIEDAVAAADAAPIKHPGLAKAPPAKPVPHGGYLFVALKKYEVDGATKEYGQKTDDSGTMLRSYDRFGFAAIPAEYGKPSKLTYIIDQDYVIWCKDTGGKVPDAYPASPREGGWKMADDMDEEGDEEPSQAPPRPPAPPPPRNP